MAIDVFNEEVMTLTEAARKLPKRRSGRKPHVSTLFRWAVGGLRSRDGMQVRLETIQIGGTKCTSLEALQRFFERLTGGSLVVYQPTLTQRQRLKRIEMAEAELKAAGV